MIKRIGKRICYFYEVMFAPHFLAFIYWPLIKIFQKLNIIFIVNIANGVGHVFAETDNYLRIKFLDQKLKNKKFILVAKPSCLFLGMKAIYFHHFYKIFCGYFWYFLFLPLTVRFKDISLDCGISRMKWQIGVKKVKGQFPFTFLERLSKIDGIKQTLLYYQRCKDTPNFFPLTDLNLKTKIINTKQKVALIVLKDLTRNASAEPTDPYSLLEALKYLKELGFYLVLAGREKMPQCFKLLEIYDYANSPFATFKNDILLFNQATIVLSSASGISFLADRMDKPFLYINSWHLSMNMPSKKCVMVPTLLRKKVDKNYLKFSSQMMLYESLSQNENFDFEDFDAINASSDEIFQGLYELLNLNDSLSDLQKKYKALSSEISPLKYGQSRCSHYFLKKYLDLLS